MHNFSNLNSYQFDSFSSRQDKGFPTIKLSKADEEREISILRSLTQMKSIMKMITKDAPKIKQKKVAFAQKANTQRGNLSNKLRSLRISTFKKVSETPQYKVRENVFPLWRTPTNKLITPSIRRGARKDTVVSSLRRKVFPSQDNLIFVSAVEPKESRKGKVSVTDCLNMCEEMLENSSEMKNIIKTLGEQVSFNEKFEKRITSQMREKKDFIKMFPQIKEKFSIQQDNKKKVIFIKENEEFTQIKENFDDLNDDKVYLKKLRLMSKKKGTKEKHRKVESLLGQINISRNKAESRLHTII